ncbi:MAG: hypothetical protein EZS28_011484 [Streblomastix strix]|uniref:Uncharacterized protein n=1 Tax=Streblomastix strix TaxID=222440 RepID=A0A5J4WDM4_9EUKA|nr:MAG: hypothetical protein EZS28_011484 [Streblomastix strix]
MKNKDVDQSKLVTLNTSQVITGYKQFTQPIQADKFIKIGGTDNQILLANGDTIDKDKLDYEPIENATQQAVAYGIGTSRNIPLNAFMHNTKQPTTPVVWLNPIAIDCYIDPDGHVKINSICNPNCNHMTQDTS